VFCLYLVAVHERISYIRGREQEEVTQGIERCHLRRKMF
jgi:hypothetical protein